VTKRLVLLYWHPVEKAALMKQYDLEPAALNREWIQSAEKHLTATERHLTATERHLTATERHLKVHLWIDVGMGREGVLPEDALPLARLIRKSKTLTLAGVATHFPIPMKSNKSGSAWLHQGNYRLYQKKFNRVLNLLKSHGCLPANALIHAGASNVVNQGLRNLYYNMVRIGSLIYFGDRPYFTYVQKILQIKDLQGPYGYKRKVQNQPGVTRVALTEISGDRRWHMRFFIGGHPVEVEQLMPGVLNVTGLPWKVKIGDSVTIQVRKKERDQTY
jgi:alanine racemase